jgi:hypothetical protein
MIGLLRGASPYARYGEEILSHAGLAWKEVAQPDLAAALLNVAALLVVGQPLLNECEQNAIAAWVAGGGALVVTGGTAGLDAILGARETGPLVEGYLAIDAAHPVTDNLTSSLHVFGGAKLRAAGGASLGKVLDANRAPTGADAIVANRYGQGVAVAIGPDLPFSVLHIQLGTPVWTDGLPAPDGTAPIDEAILKCDDGVVLHWEHDRAQQPLAEAVPECPGKHPNYPLGDTPWFMEPVADELRGLLLKALAWAAAETGKALPALWYWPAGLPAVGLLSHDSDLNIDAAAQTTLGLLDELGINSTWCIMTGPNWPDRFTRQTYQQIKAAGHELALHYNALPLDGGFWSEAEFERQLAWVKQETGAECIVSNKNHYTRWEGKLEFFRWLEKAGIESDQSKGPSKKGNIGYLHGSCQPWFPLDGEEQRFMNVLEIPLQTQDLWLTAPTVIQDQIIAMAAKHHGVAHFLYHQVHIHRLPEVMQALRETIAAGRAAGLQWWTGARINRWERLRRKVSVGLEATGEGRLALVASSPEAVPGATLAVVLPAGAAAEAWSAHPAGPDVAIAVRAGDYHGLKALFIQTDLPAGVTRLELRARTAPISR